MNFNKRPSNLRLSLNHYIQFKKHFERLFPLRVLPNKLVKVFVLRILKKGTLVKKIYGNPMLLPIDCAGIGNTLAIFQERELDQRDIILSTLRDGDTILEIGANIGYYVLVELSAIGRNGKIYAYEPDARNTSVLIQNVLLNKATNVVEIFEEAISSVNGEAEFHIAEKSNLNSMHISRGEYSPALIARNANDRKYLSKILTKTRGLCNVLLESERPIDLIRMDIEGHEVEVLTSLLDGLKIDMLGNKSPRAILFEPHSWEYTGCPNNMFRLLTELHEYGYIIKKLGTRDESKSPINRLGYRPDKLIREKRGMTRGVYTNVHSTDAIWLASSVDGVTSVLLERGQPNHVNI